MSKHIRSMVDSDTKACVLMVHGVFAGLALDLPYSGPAILLRSDKI